MTFLDSGRASWKGEGPSPWRGRFVLGLAGPSGSGKSTAADILKSRGAWVVHGDSLGRLALEDPITALSVREAFGLRTLDRPRLARKVFGDPGALAKLSALTWPFIGRRASEALDRRRSGLLVFDAAVLLEAGWNKLCDGVIVLRSSEELRFQRLLALGLEPGEAAARIRSQARLGTSPGADEVWRNECSVRELSEALSRFLRRRFVEAGGEKAPGALEERHDFTQSAFPQTRRQSG